MRRRKYWLLLIVLIVFNVSAQNHSVLFSNSDTFFKNYTDQGTVNYSSIVQDPNSLNELILLLKNDVVPEDAEKAYLINAYNLFVINKVVQEYPITSPMDVNGFFTENDNFLNGKKISLNDLENEVLRKEHPDPRLHFVLVCGAVGCPPIASYAYMPDLLDAQLDKQTKAAINNDDFIYERESKIFLSEIFKWYTEDFGKNTDDILQYINGYRINKFNEGRIEYYPYNWSLNETSTKEIGIIPLTTEPDHPSLIEVLPNLQTFNAGSLLGQGKMDFTLFNTLYTESKNNWKGIDYTGYRSTFVTHLFQWTIGVTKNKRFNIGVDINFKSSGTSSDSTFSGIRNAFLYKNNDSSRVGVTSAGLRFKVQPFKSVPDFSIQSTILIPTIKHPEGYSHATEQNLYWADWDRITWWNQLFYSKNFGQKFQLFTEFDLLFRFRKNRSQIGMLDLPASVFISYFPTRKITIYAMAQHVHRFTNNITPQDPNVTDWVIPANYTTTGLGFKYQLLPNLNLELLYTNFVRGRNSGLGNTFNLGLKFLTR